jgi:signal transduction histidine kinase
MILFLLFLAEKAGYRILHMLLVQDVWWLAEKLLDAVIIYISCVLCGFSLLRRYKAKVLWQSSMLHRLKLDLDEYFGKRTFSYRLFCLYGGFLLAQIVGAAGIAASIVFWRYPAAKAALVLIAVVLIGLDYRAYHYLFTTSMQEDKIADAIETIANGDTSYQMPLDGLYGKELAMANNINQIGTGLERAIQEQFKSERLKADLITNVSHDIKTPLTSIINYVDLIKREHIENDHLKEYLTVLEQKSQRLKTLTEDLVEASKASSGNLKLDMRRLDLVEMIWQTNGEFEEKYEERHLELVTSLPSGSLMIEADGRHLWRVLENLYNNAFKYAMENSRVYTEVTSGDGMVWFTIKNVSEHPLNISPDELTERFVRGDVSRTTEGSGLGLSIAQSLTKLQGGTFEVVIDGDLFKARVGFVLIE